MNLLPVVTRELIIRARSSHMLWVRLGFAAIGVLVCLQYFLLWGGAGLVQVGSYAFQALAWMACLCAASGFVLTADSVSAERREGTLGLLLLTRLGIPDILAGKLASTGLSAFLGLAAVTPILMLPVLAGGVKATQVIRVALSLPGLLFLSLCAGLWASSKSRRAIRSFGRAGVCVGSILGPALFLGKLQSVAGIPALGEWVQSLSPGAAFLWGAGAVTIPVPAAYWLSAASGFIEGGILLAMASKELRRSWREDEDVQPPGAGQRSHIQPLDDAVSPLRWLLLRSKAQSRVIWVGIVLTLLPQTTNIVLAALGSSGLGINFASSFLGSLASGLALSYAGAMFFLESRRSGALEILRTTPEGFKCSVSDQWMVLRERLTGPILLMVLASILLTAFSWNRLGWQLPQSAVGLLNHVFDALALCWLGMWFGYHSRSPWAALLWPVGLVIGLDLVLSYGFYAILGLFLRGVGFRGAWGTTLITLLVCFPSLLGIAKQIWLMRWARQRLRSAWAGASVEPLDLRRSALQSVRQVMATVEKARHWTPGGES